MTGDRQLPLEAPDAVVRASLGLAWAVTRAQDYEENQALRCKDPAIEDGGGACGWRCGCYSEEMQEQDAEIAKRVYAHRAEWERKYESALIDWLGEDGYVEAMTCA